MVTIRINGIDIELTEDNETNVKKHLANYPLNTDVVILETNEVLKINDIFDYEGN